MNKATATRRAQEVLTAAMAGGPIPAPGGGEVRDDAPARLTLRAAFDQYLAHLKARGLRSIANRRSHAAAWCASLGQGTAPEKITITALDAFEAEPGRAPATINRHLATLKHAASWWEERGIISIETAARIRKRKLLPEPQERIRHVRADEQRRLLDAIDRLDPELRVLVVLAMLTGARRSELTKLRRADVDLARGAITIEHTKTGTPRTVPMHPDVRSIVASLLAQEGEPTAFLIPLTLGPGRGRSEAARRAERATRAFREVADAAQIDDLRLHDLRHTFATRTREAGIGLDVIQRLLGHTTIATTRRYAHLADDHMRDAVNALASIAPALPPHDAKV
ncbi:Integrase [Sandaracinus amylolyticus]|uniref:Integrase n=1 Tax=Sandaracinus amylolyticus TaxID=927083 RepID=A0A0F6W6I2_9BACT|nr:Integrase [Sandaracinus amylolyticus]